MSSCREDLLEGQLPRIWTSELGKIAGQSKDRRMAGKPSGGRGGSAGTDALPEDVVEAGLP